MNAFQQASIRVVNRCKDERSLIETWINVPDWRF